MKNKEKTKKPKKKIKKGITVVGLGRVGLPFSLVLADAGNTVYGVDTNKLIEKLLNKQAPFRELGLLELLTNHVGKNFLPTTDLNSAVASSEFIVIMVGVNMSSNKPDISNLEELFKKVARDVAGKTIILRTTVPLGTTEHLKNLIEEITGFSEGVEFFLVFAPERVVEGKSIEEYQTLPVVIGAFDEGGFERAKQLFETIGSGNTIIKLNPKEAELVKLTDNSFRNVSFAFSNDLALLAESLGIDGLKVIRAANQDYPRNNIPLPSYGVSGYCLSKDPIFFEYAFQEISKRRGFNSLAFYGRLVNNYLIDHVCRAINYFIEKHKASIDKIKILIAGLTFKEDIDDFRYSHGVELTRRLAEDPRFEVAVHDPYLDFDGENPYVTLPEDIKDKVTVHQDLTEAFKGLDIVVFTVKHETFKDLNEGNKIFDLVSFMRKPAIIIDGWNIFPKIYNLGIEGNNEIIYKGAGRLPSQKC